MDQENGLFFCSSWTRLTVKQWTSNKWSYSVCLCFFFLSFFLFFFWPWTFVFHYERKKPKTKHGIQDSEGLSSHVTVHILANEDKYLCEYTKFQGNLRQINHLQFYPCPLGRLAGPWCSAQSVMRGTSSSALYKPELLLKQEKNKWISDATSLEGRHFLKMAWRLDLQDHPFTPPQVFLSLLTWGFH